MNTVDKVTICQYADIEAKAGKKDVSTALNLIINSVNQHSKSLNELSSILARLVEAANTATPKAKTTDEKPLPNEAFAELQKSVKSLQQDYESQKKINEHVTKQFSALVIGANALGNQHIGSQSDLFERKAISLAASYFITISLSDLLPLALKEIAFLQMGTQFAIGILSFAILNKVAEKLIENFNFEKFLNAGKAFIVFLKVLVGHLGNLITKCVIQPSAALAQFAWNLLKWIIKLAAIPLLVASGLHFGKPDLNSTALILNATNDFIASYQLTELANAIFGNSYSPYGIACFLALLVIGTLKNGYDQYFQNSVKVDSK